MARLCLDHSKSAKLRKTSRSRVFITEIQHKIAEDCRSGDRRPFWSFFFPRGTREIQIGQLSAVCFMEHARSCGEKSKMATVG